MGLAFVTETGKRISPTTDNAPIVGGPYYGRAYYPRDQSAQRVHFVRDRGGLPFDQAALTGPSGVTNLIQNPRFETGTTGWTGVTRMPYGGMWGAGGCGKIGDLDTTLAEIDAYYTYDRGSALSTDEFFFGVWARIPAAADGVNYDTDSISIKLRMQDTAGSPLTAKTQSYRQIKAADGWVWLTLSSRGQSWTGNVLNVGIEFKITSASAGGLFLDGAILVAYGAVAHANGVAYHDGTMTSSAWSGSADASTTTVATRRDIVWPIANIPYSTREGFLSAFCFPANSPDLTIDFNATSTKSALGIVAYFGSYAGGSFQSSLSLSSGTSTNANGWTISGGVGPNFGFTNNLVGWPRCVYHMIVSWSERGAAFGVRGYFDPADYSLDTNVYTASSSSDVDQTLDATTGILSVGSKQSDATAFNGYVWDVNVGNRGLSTTEIQGMLKHGPGPYTGTVAWAPLNSDTNLLLVEAVSFHADGPLGIAEAGYAPQSGLVAVSGGGRPNADLTRATTQNVTDSFSFVGRGNDVQLTHRSISDLSRLFENVHRNNEQGARYKSFVAWSMDPLQLNHPTLRNFPAPRQVRSGLVSGNIEMDPRLAGFYGRHGNIWGTVRFERWGLWQGPRTQLLLAKNNTSVPALTFATDNFNNASSTTDSNYFEVPEGMVEGDLEAPCLVYFRSPGAGNTARIRMARRSRGVPADVVAIYEGEAAANIFAGLGGTVAAAAQSGAAVRSITDLDSTDGSVSWIIFEIIDQNSTLPDWLFGEYRVLVWVNAASVLSASDISFRGRVNMGDGFSGSWGEWITPAEIITTNYQAQDLGIFRIPPVQIPLRQTLTSGAGAGQGLGFTLQVKRNTAGTTTLNCDCMMLLPCDENYVQIDRNNLTAATTGNNSMVSALLGEESAVETDASDRFTDIAIMRTRGVYIQPGRPNRYWLMVDTHDGTRYATDETSGATVTMYYTPIYLLLPSYEGGGGGGWA